jgi:hypothetical protein
MDEAVKGLEAQAVIQACGEMPRPDDAARINNTTHAENVATTIREEVKMNKDLTIIVLAVCLIVSTFTAGYVNETCQQKVSKYDQR